MRMSYMYYLLKKSLTALQSIDIETKAPKGGTKFTYFKNFQVLNKTINDLYGTGLWTERLEPIRKYFKFVTPRAVLTTSEEDGQAISNTIRYLIDHIGTMVDFLGKCGFDAQQLGFDVKMPPTDDFSEFVKNIDMFQKVLNQCPYLTIDGESVKIQSVDTGSIWLKFAVVATSTSLILSNLATIVDKCVKIQSHYITIQQQEEMLHRMQLKNDTLSVVVDANKQCYNWMVDNAATELEQEIPNVELSNEDKERVKMSIDNLVKLIDKGMEIYASIDAPEEVKDLFPTSDEIKSLSEPLKQLSESNDEE